MSMRRKRITDDDDDLHRDVARDGEVVHCPVHLRDARQQAVAAMRWPHHADRQTGDADYHRPGYRISVDSDARAGARAARDAMIERVSSAWRTPGRDAAEPDAAEELLRRHMRTEPDDDAQARRDRAYSDYCDRLGSAWKIGKTDPSEAARVKAAQQNWLGK
jgi:hypothetical protein